MTNKIYVQMDTLRYTRAGLATRVPLDLRVGTHNNVVLVRPTRVRPVQAGHCGFARDSSFPLPGTLLGLWSSKPVGAAFSHHTAIDPAWGGDCVQVYGHCSSPGEDDANKALADRRARIGAALLRTDFEAFVSVADEEGWGVDALQSMLRTLACDPGPVDGKAERLTNDAARLFADRYNRGVYHPNLVPPDTQLSIEVVSLQDVRLALMEAFVLVQGCSLPSTQLHAEHPSHGCGAFNLIDSGRLAPNRRVSIVVHAERPAHSENAPCVSGDANACAVVDEHTQRCLWYREHIADAASPSVTLFDPRWLWLGDDRYVLSALTTADDEAAVQFQLLETDADSGDIRTEGEVLNGVVRGGVAAVVWASGRTPEAADGRPPGDHLPRFRAHHPEDSGSHPVEADWPTRETLQVLAVTDAPESLRARSGVVRVRALDGSYEHLSPFSSAQPLSPRHLALEFPSVPMNVRLEVTVESGELRWPIFERAEAKVLRDGCRSGDMCQELPPAPPLPQYDLDEVELDWTASVGVDEELEPQDVLDGHGFPWIDDDD